MFHVVRDTSENSWYRLNSASPSLVRVGCRVVFTILHDLGGIVGGRERGGGKRRWVGLSAGPGERWLPPPPRGFDSMGSRWSDNGAAPSLDRGKRTCSIRGFLEGSPRRNNESRCSSTVPPRILFLRDEEGKEGWNDARMTRSRWKETRRRGEWKGGEKKREEKKEGDVWQSYCRRIREKNRFFLSGREHPTMRTFSLLFHLPLPRRHFHLVYFSIPLRAFDSVRPSPVPRRAESS